MQPLTVVPVCNYGSLKERLSPCLLVEIFASVVKPHLTMCLLDPVWLRPNCKCAFKKLLLNNGFYVATLLEGSDLERASLIVFLLLNVDLCSTSKATVGLLVALL